MGCIIRGWSLQWLISVIQTEKPCQNVQRRGQFLPALFCQFSFLPSFVQFIALERLESLYKSCDYVSNLCVHATPGANNPVAVIFPHEANLRHAISLSTDPALARLQEADFAAICSDPYVKHLVLKECNAVGAKNGLKGPEVLCGVVLTPEEWTPETGLVSAAMKLKRNVVAQVFEKDIKVSGHYHLGQFVSLIEYPAGRVRLSMKLPPNLHL